MPSTTTRNINISLNVLEGTSKQKLGGLASGLQSIANALTAIQKISSVATEGISTISNSLASLKGNVPDLSGFAKSIKDISSKGSAKNLEAVSNALKSFEGIKLPDGLSQFSDSLSRIASVSIPKKLSVQITDFFKSMSLLSTIDFRKIDFASIDKLVTSLSTFSSLKIPSNRTFKSFIDGIGSLSTIKFPSQSTVDGLVKIAVSLKKFVEVRLPSAKTIQSFANGIHTLGSVKYPTANDAIRLQTIADGLKKFESITRLPRSQTITSFANGIASLSRIKPTNVKILTDIANALMPFASIKGLPNLDKFVKSVNSIATIDAGKLRTLALSIKSIANSLGNISNVAGLVNALNRLSQQANQTNQSVNQMNQTVRSSGDYFEMFRKRIVSYSFYTIIAQAAMMLSQSLRYAFTEIVNYDQALKDLQAITMATSSEVEKMGAKIIEVAAGTKFSASEVAEGMKILGQAGLTASEAVQAIQGVSDLATGTLSDMATTVDLVTTALSVFDIDARNTSNVVDVFANAVNRSKLTIDKLRIAINYVGPIAKDAGVTFDEMSAAMGSLANSGIRASTIGTSLRQIFSELLSPSKALKQAAKEYGISLSELDPRVTSFSKVLKNLGVILTDSQNAMEIFGLRGASAALALTGTDSNFEELLGTIRETGTASEMAQIQMGGLGVILKNLKDRFGVLAIAMGKLGITEAIRIMALAIKQVVIIMTALIDNPMARFIVKTGVLVIALLNLNKILNASVLLFIKLEKGLKLVALTGAATRMTTFAASTMTAVNAVGLLALAFNPLMLVLVGISAVVAKGIFNDLGLKRASQEASDAAVKFDELSKSLIDYGLKINDIDSNSDEYYETNKQLRKSLLETSKGYSEVSDEARAAAESIDPLTGMIDKQSGALDRYAEKLKALKLQSLIDAANLSADNFEASSKALYTVTRSFGDNATMLSEHAAEVGSSFKTMLADGEIKSGFDQLMKSMKDLEESSQNLTESTEFIKQVKLGLKTYKEINDEITLWRSSAVPLSKNQKEFAGNFDLMKQKAQDLFTLLRESGKITPDISNEYFKSLFKGVDDPILFDALNSQFERFKEVSARTFSNILEQWNSDFNADSANTPIQKLIKQAEDAGIKLDEIKKKESLANEQSRKALAEQYKTLVDQKKKDLQDSSLSKEQRLTIEKDFYRNTTELLRKSVEERKKFAKDDLVQELQKIDEITKARDKSLADNEVKYKDSGARLLAYNAEVYVKYQDAIDRIKTGAVDPKEAIAQVKESAEAIEEEYSELYKNLSLRLAKKEITELQYLEEKQREENKAKSRIEKLWTDLHNLLLAQGDVEIEHVRKVNSARVDAAIAANKAILENEKDIAEERESFGTDLFNVTKTEVGKIEEKYSELQVKLDTKLAERKISDLDYVSAKTDLEERAAAEVLNTWSTAYSKIFLMPFASEDTVRKAEAERSKAFLELKKSQGEGDKKLADEREKQVKDYLDTVKDTVKGIEEEYSIHYAELEIKRAKNQVSESSFLKQKQRLEKEANDKIVGIWTDAYKESQNMQFASEDQIRQFNSERVKAVLKANKDISDNARAIGKEQEDIAKKAQQEKLAAIRKAANEEINILKEKQAQTGNLSTELERFQAEYEIQRQISLKTIELKEAEYAAIASSSKSTAAEIIEAEQEIAQAQADYAVEKIESEREYAQKRLDIIRDLWEQGKVSVDEYRAAMEQAFGAGAYKTVEEFKDEMTLASDDIWGGFTIGVRRAAKDFQTEAELMAEIGQGLADRLSSGLGDMFDSFIDGSKTAGQAFADFARSTIQWIAQIILKQMILNAIQKLMPGFSSGGSVSAPDPGKFSLGMADGGSVPGYSPTSTSDNILAWLTADEFVHPVKAVAHYGKAFMESVRSLRFPRSLALEGVSGRLLSSVPRSNRLASGGQAVAANQTLKAGDINLSIMNMIDRDDFIGGFLKSPKGQHILMNVIKRNGSFMQTING